MSWHARDRPRYQDHGAVFEALDSGTLLRLGLSILQGRGGVVLHRRTRHGGNGDLQLEAGGVMASIR